MVPCGFKSRWLYGFRAARERVKPGFASILHLEQIHTLGRWDLHDANDQGLSFRGKGQ
jgi:hypothetical protein